MKKILAILLSLLTLLFLRASFRLLCRKNAAGYTGY